MSDYKIDPGRLKITEHARRARGAQGTVIVATLVPAEGTMAASSEQMVAVKMLEWERGDVERSAKFFKVSHFL